MLHLGEQVGAAGPEGGRRHGSEVEGREGARLGDAGLLTGRQDEVQVAEAGQGAARVAGEGEQGTLLLGDEGLAGADSLGRLAGPADGDQERPLLGGADGCRVKPDLGAGETVSRDGEELLQQ